MSGFELDLGLEPDGDGEPEPEAGATFYLDLGHPASFLVAERILPLMPVATEWVPVDLGGIANDPTFTWAEIETAARERGLLAVRRPPSLPGELAALAATFAKQTGRAVAFGQAALRQAYAGARDLTEPDNVLIAASGCELHPRAVLQAVTLRGVRDALATATATARTRGAVHGPAIWTGERMLLGDAAVEQAAALLA